MTEKKSEPFELNKDRKRLIKYNENESHVILPDNIEVIGDGAFKGKNLTSIVIPETVTEIGHYAFQGCKNLTSLYIPQSVKIIGDYAFKGCKKLNSIEVPASVRRIGRGACDYTDEQPEIKTDNSIVDDFRAKTAEKFNTMDSWSAADIEDLIKNHVIETLQENEIQFREDSVRAVLYGSRARGLEQSGSDIDVVVEIDTDEREDHLFNLLNSKPYMFSSENYESIPVDINPITPYETGTLEMYLPRAEEYLAEKAENMERENNVSALDRAKNLINDFCVSEYNSEADLSDLSNVSLAYTTDEEFELPIQVSADLENYRINYEYDGEIFKTEQYDSIDDMNSNGLTGLDFNDLVSVPDSVIEKHNKDRNNSEIENSEEKSVNDTVPPQDYKYQELPQLTGKQKYKANVEAIKTLQDLESENRNATPEEQAVLAQYSGWGGIPQAFDPDNKGWEKEYHELKELLTESEYSAARASTLTSFYTPPELTNAVYQALTQFGFEGGNVLEPSMGVGNFFGKMPEEMHDNSKLYGVELDSISGRISKKLYPNANVQTKGFESTKFADNSFDVALGNIPFGDIPVSDKAYDKYNLKIHDYFACKMIDKVKPNGIAAFVSSKFVMDKMNDKARRYIAERADLLGAVRLPTNAFGDTATTTDILFFKKKELRSLEIPDWVQMSQTPDGIPCNKYFADNPDMVLGKMAWDERMRGKYGAESKVTTCVPTEGDLKQKLTAAVAKIQEKIETVKSKVSDKKQAEVIPADPDVKNFTYTLVGKELYFRKNEIMEKSDVKGSKRDRIAAFCGLRKAAFDVINAQVSNCSDKELDKLQKTLNEVYDRFKAKFGNINDRANSLALKEDDDYNTLCAFEITNKRTGELEKSEIFFKRTITAEEEITKVDTPAEALQVSLDRKGKVDIEYMAQLTEKEPEKVIEELGTEIFRNPAKLREDDPFSGYEDKSEYLSGNVREKLELAEKFTEHIAPEYERNVKALQEVIPPTIPAEDISVELGCSWIDVSDYSKFMEEYAKADMKNHPLRRDRAGEYKVESKSVSWIRDINSTATYGTSRLNSYQIFENLLNKRSMTVRDKKTDDEGKEYYVVNDKETELARDKAKKMKEEFPKWFWGDINRREKYVERYNKLFITPAIK